MNENQKSFGDFFAARWEENKAQYGANAANFTTGSVFTFTSEIMKSVGYGTLGNASRALYGTAAGIIIGDGETGSTVGSIAGTGVGLLTTFAAAFFVGSGMGAIAAVSLAAGFTGTFTSFVVETLWESYSDYSSYNPTAPSASDVLPQDMGTFNPEGIVLQPIVIETGADQNPLTGYYGAMSDMLNIIDDLNHSYEHGLSLDYFLSMDSPAEWANWFYSHDDATFGWEFADRITAAMIKLKEEYQENKEEIDKADPSVAEKIQKMEQSIQAMTTAADDIFSPLAFDLNGDGVQTISIHDSQANFDFGYGQEVAHGWLSAEDAFLALDKNGNGSIDDASELFGSRNRDGFSMLEDYDLNQDGIIDSSDPIFENLLLWQDYNSDGISQSDELRSLTDHGITSIKLNPTISDTSNNGNWLPLTSSYTTTDGAEKTVGDVYLSRFDISKHDDIINNPSDSYVVVGGRGDDVLSGSIKDQIFVGGLGKDTFVFGDNFGNDTIKDFDPFTDSIVLDSSYENLSDFISYAYSSGNDTVIDFGNNNSITFINTDINALSNLNVIYTS